MGRTVEARHEFFEGDVNCMTDDLLGRTRRHIAFHTERFKSEYGGCVRPLFHEDYDRNRPAPFGSCVLFRIGDEHFILSAAHVLDWLSTSVVYLGNATRR